jgi:hypothetical protein
MEALQLPQRSSGEHDGKEIAMSETTKYLGLCSTCKSASTCTYPRDSERPVHYCCEHEGYQECEGSVSLALLRTGNIFSLPSDSVTTSPTTERDSGMDKGLCKNCGNRETCTFPKPEGGVWHCDEYQ